MWKSINVANNRHCHQQRIGLTYRSAFKLLQLKWEPCIRVFVNRVIDNLAESSLYNPFHTSKYKYQKNTSVY